jgi:hypothetical protein
MKKRKLVFGVNARGVTRVRGSLQIDLRDFEIEYPVYLAAAVAPEVEVAVEMSVERAAAPRMLSRRSGNP